MEGKARSQCEVRACVRACVCVCVDWTMIRVTHNTCTYAQECPLRSSPPSLISFFGANYIWTTLHDFGGTDGMKGNMSQINEIPFAGMSPERDTSVWGTGFTPEGIDQVRVRY